MNRFKRFLIFRAAGKPLKRFRESNRNMITRLKPSVNEKKAAEWSHPHSKLFKSGFTNSRIALSDHNNSLL